MNKYGISNFYIEELEKVNEGQSLDEREIFYIKKYNSISPNGYNITKGGSKFRDDNPMYHEEIRKKVSEQFKGEKNPAKRPEVKEKIRLKAIGRKASKETREKMSKNSAKIWKNKKLPQEAIEKRRNTVINSGCYKYGNNPMSKPVARLDKNTEEVLQIYSCQTEAVEWIKNNYEKYKNISINSSNISQVCHGKQKTAFGFKWKLI